MCSLEEAFQTISESRNDDLLANPGMGLQASNSTSQEDSDIQEKKKKKEKKRRAPMPPSEEVVEPDRPAHKPRPLPERLGVDHSKESKSITQMLDAVQSADLFPHPATDSMNANAYLLEPNWASSFHDTSAPDWIKSRMPQRHVEAPLVPSAWVDGGPTLWKKVPEKQQEQVDLDVAERKVDRNIDDLQRKFDIMFKKLEELEHVRTESQHLEIILFVLGGIFILLLLDLLVKQGTQAMVLIGGATATVGGRYFSSS
jgi:hypothetical protein